MAKGKWAKLVCIHSRGLGLSNKKIEIDFNSKQEIVQRSLDLASENPILVDIKVYRYFSILFHTNVKIDIFQSTSNLINFTVIRGMILQ